MRADYASRSGDIGTNSAVRPSTSTHQRAHPADVAPRFDDTGANAAIRAPTSASGLSLWPDHK